MAAEATLLRGVAHPFETELLAALNGITAKVAGPFSV
jgi:hypothetical protein